MDWFVGIKKVFIENQVDKNNILNICSIKSLSPQEEMSITPPGVILVSFAPGMLEPECQRNTQFQ